MVFSVKIEIFHSHPCALWLSKQKAGHCIFKFNARLCCYASFKIAARWMNFAIDNEGKKSHIINSVSNNAFQSWCCRGRMKS